MDLYQLPQHRCLGREVRLSTTTISGTDPLVSPLSKSTSNTKRGIHLTTCPLWDWESHFNFHSMPMCDPLFWCWGYATCASPVQLPLAFRHHHNGHQHLHHSQKSSSFDLFSYMARFRYLAIEQCNGTDPILFVNIAFPYTRVPQRGVCYSVFNKI